MSKKRSQPSNDDVIAELTQMRESLSKCYRGAAARRLRAGHRLDCLKRAIDVFKTLNKIEQRAAKLRPVRGKRIKVEPEKRPPFEPEPIRHDN